MTKKGRYLSRTLIVLVVIALVAAASVVLFQSEVDAKKPASPPGQDKKDNGNGNNYPETIYLQDIDSGLTSPTGVYRWLDVANHAYATSYRDSYDYTQATVTVSYAPVGEVLEGILAAHNLKPNFAYQVKLGGDPINHPEANENIGFVGRWWRETWDGSGWTSGTNSNDTQYNSQKDTPDDIGGSPTGLKYKFSGYLVFDYFITDSKGNASLEFEVNSSYHVLWKTSQPQFTRRSIDGPIKSTTFRINAKKSEAYDTNYAWTTVGVYGQVERTPVGGKYPDAGTYNCQFFLTEESFHGDGGTYAGNWAAAMGAPIEFEITE